MNVKVEEMEQKAALIQITCLLNFLSEEHERQEAENVDQELVADDVNEVFEETHRWK